MTADWPQIDSTVSLHASNDLFGGDFFGDELNDMYISGEGDIGLNEHVTDKNNGTSTPPSGEIDHGLDSIAFSDFTDLMPPEAAAVSPVTAPEPVCSSDNNPNKRPLPPSGNDTSSFVPISTLNKKINNKPKKALVSAAVRQAPSIMPSLKNNKAPAPAPISQASVPVNKAKGKKNAQTPNPLSNGNASGAVVSPLPAPAAFVAVPAPVTSGVAVGPNNNVHVTDNNNVPNRVVTKPQASKKGSATTIYAPSRQMCTPAVAQANSVMKNISMSNTRPHNTNAIATAAAAASASPPDSSDFAAVAQAAVTNLILNAGSHASQLVNQKNVVSDHDDDCDPSTVQRKIDTSTAHVTALTSPNWVAACASMTSTIPGTSVTAPIVSSSHLPALEITSNDNEDETPAAKRRRQNLNPEERAKQNRDRNREHARNTRLRKKAYVEELKRTLTELVAQRDANELEKRRNAQRELEQREVRFRVMEEFLKLRGSNEPNVARWVAILEDGFTLTLPFTNYRSVVKGVDANAKLTRQVSGDQNCNEVMNSGDDKQTLYGAPECMADATALSGMLSTFGKGSKLSLAYECDRKRFLMDGTNAVLEWTAKSVGVHQEPSPAVFTTRGSMRASFSPASNKLISCELCFDTGPVINQLKKQHAPTFSLHDDFAANIFGGGASDDASRLLDSLEMPMLPGQSPMSRGVSQKSIVSGDIEHEVA